jgi:hypothetical protein
MESTIDLLADRHPVFRTVMSRQSAGVAPALGDAQAFIVGAKAFLRLSGLRLLLLRDSVGIPNENC